MRLFAKGHTAPQGRSGSRLCVLSKAQQMPGAWSSLIKGSQCKFRPWSQKDPHEYLSSATYSRRDLSQASRPQVPQSPPLLKGHSSHLPSEAVVRTKVNSTLLRVWWEENAVEISLSACLKGKLRKK